MIGIASYDGGSVFVFSAEGRHLKTIDAFTGTTQLAFDYGGLLIAPPVATPCRRPQDVIAPDERAKPPEKR